MLILIFGITTKTQRLQLWNKYKRIVTENMETQRENRIWTYPAS